MGELLLPLVGVREKMSGKEVPLLATPSPQNRACDFHRTRLKQIGSYKAVASSYAPT